jgi:hypothetical protein
LNKQVLTTWTNAQIAAAQHLNISDVLAKFAGIVAACAVGYLKWMNRSTMAWRSKAVSHFSKLSVRVLKAGIAHDVASKMGWTITHEREHVNRYSREAVRDCDVYRDAKGTVKMVVDAKGDVTHDTYYMGVEANQFLCQYSEAYIRSVASGEGAMVYDRGVDKQGNRVLEVAYLC